MRFLFNVFDESKINLNLRHYVGVDSFFEGHFRVMSCVERQQAFGLSLAWVRRKAFLVFLVNQGYLHTYSNDRSLPHQNVQEVTCDLIFDVEDLFRTICNYL